MGHRILIIDDSQTMAQMLQVILKQAGFETEIANSGRLGVEVFDKFMPDVILLDIEMPIMDGFVTLGKLKNKMALVKHKVPVIMLTGKTGKEDVIRALKEGAADYIAKPVDKESLVEKLKKHIASS